MEVASDLEMTWFWDNRGLLRAAEAPLAVPPGGAFGHLVTYSVSDVLVAVSEGEADSSPFENDPEQFTLVDVRPAISLGRREFECLKLFWEWSDSE